MHDGAYVGFTEAGKSESASAPVWEILSMTSWPCIGFIAPPPGITHPARLRHSISEQPRTATVGPEVEGSSLVCPGQTKSLS